MKAIKSMTFDELVKMKMQIESAIYSLIDGERRQLKKAMGRFRVPGSATTGRGRRKLRGKSLRGKKLPVRFRNPQNLKETWAGRGLKPRWLVAALKGRKKKLADFAVG